MEVDGSGSKPLAMDDGNGKGGREGERVVVNRKALQAVLEQCQRALELIRNTADYDDVDVGSPKEEEEIHDDGSSFQCGDSETVEWYDLLKSRVESPNFLERLESAQALASQNLAAEEGSSWDVVSETDIWEGGNIGEVGSGPDDYVLVRQEDIVEGIACFMAAYLLSVKQTKELNPNQLQEALSKTFSVQKKKGKFQKAWEGSKVLYNVASWGATAIGIYQNPALFRAASVAYWTSCRVISKLF